MAQAIQRKLERLKQMACISRQVSLTGSPKRFSRALRSTAPADKVVDNTRTFYHAHPQQSSFSSLKPSGRNGRGQKTGWDTSFAQVPSDDYVRNVRNCKILQKTSASISRSKSRSHPQNSLFSCEPQKQLASPRRISQEVGIERAPFQEQAPAPAVMPSAAAILRQLKEEQRYQHAAQDGGAAQCSNSKTHSAVCESHTLGSHAAKERVKHKHRKSEGCASQTTQPGAARAASKLDQGAHHWQAWHCQPHVDGFSGHRTSRGLYSLKYAAVVTCKGLERTLHGNHSAWCPTFCPVPGAPGFSCQHLLPTPNNLCGFRSSQQISRWTWSKKTTCGCANDPESIASTQTAEACGAQPSASCDG